MRTSERLPLWAWLLPPASAAAAALAWASWGGTVSGIVAGGVLIALSGLLVFAYALEVLRPRRGPLGEVRRWLVAIALGGVTVALALAIAGVGYYLIFRPFG